MEIRKNITPYDFLCADSWECDDLAEVICRANAVDAFNAYVEECFTGNMPTECQLNDFFRFNDDQILSDLGIKSDEEDDDKEDE